MFAKSKSVSGDWGLQPLQRSAVSRPTAMLHSEAIASISSEMAVIGKIICEDPLRIYGFVEGEVIASNTLIVDGAQIQGDIVAEELTVAGRVKGNIYALRVKLQASAVVEGDIFHRLLSIDEHAWFEGCSRPDENPPEPRSSIKAESSTPEPRQQALVAFDDQGEFKTDFTDEESTPLRRSGMRAFLVACIAIMAIGVMGHFALSALQQATGLTYTTDNVRIDPGWMEGSTQLGWTEPLPGPETAVRARFRERRKQQPLCRLSLTQSRRKRAQPFSTRGKCRRRRRVSRRRCKRRPSPLLLMQSHRKRAQPFSSRSKCRRRRRVSRRCCKRQPSPLLLMQSRRKRTPPFSIRNGCRRRRRVARRSSSPTWKFLRKSPCLGRGPPLPRRGGRCWCCRGLLERR
jgi:cytoskeletal protein CcmA (bactofilin family)